MVLSYSNFVAKTHRFLRYSTYKYTVTLKPGLGVTQSHRKQHDRSATCDFCSIVTMGLSGTVYEINSDFSRKSQIFPTPVLRPR